MCFSIVFGRQYLYLATFGSNFELYLTFSFSFFTVHTFAFRNLEDYRVWWCGRGSQHPNIAAILFSSWFISLIQSRGNWFHLPLVAGALLVLGLLLFFARYKLKKQKLRKRQKRSDEVETLLQQMDEALWDEQENLCQSSLVDPALSSKLGTLENQMESYRNPC